MRHTHTKLALTTALWITSVCGWTGSAAQEAGEKAAAATIAARQKFFGVENVNPGTGDVRRDRGRTPFGAQDLVDLHPEAIFIGHGHGDHADNAAYIAKWLNIPIYTTPETCDAMQLDVARMAADPNTVNGGSKLVPDAKPVNCVGVVPRGSVPGTAVVNIDQLNPVACIVAFKHIHSGRVPTDPQFWGSNPIVPVINDFDPREAAMYPTGTCVAPF